MRNISVTLIFIMILGCLKAGSAHAQFSQGPNQMYSPPYPYVQSTPINNLPYGAITIGVGQETYYYCKGVFYQKVIREQTYVIVPPPIGAVVFTIPQGYQLMLIDGASYYVFEGVFYKHVLDGYKVIYPPV